MTYRLHTRMPCLNCVAGMGTRLGFVGEAHVLVQRQWQMTIKYYSKSLATRELEIVVY